MGKADDILSAEDKQTDGRTPLWRTEAKEKSNKSVDGETEGILSRQNGDRREKIFGKIFSMSTTIQLFFLKIVWQIN